MCSAQRLFALLHDRTIAQEVHYTTGPSSLQMKMTNTGLCVRSEVHCICPFFLAIKRRDRTGLVDSGGFSSSSMVHKICYLVSDAVGKASRGNRNP
jgi:hypothetical protein